MHIVIDIPKGRYEDILSGKEFTVYQCDIREVLKNGTLLPKGYGDLIDKNLLTNEMEQAYKNSLSEPFAKLFVDFMAYIDDAPTIIEADKGE